MKKANLSKLRQEFLQGINLLQEGRFKASSLSLQKVLKRNVPFVSALLMDKFQFYQKEGLFEEALQVGQIILKERPEDPSLLNNLGNIARKVNDSDRALYFFDLVLEKNPKNKQILLNKIACLEKINLYDREIEAMLVANAHFDGFIVPEPLLQWSHQKQKSITNILTHKMLVKRNERLQVLMLRQELLELQDQAQEAKAVGLLIQKEEERSLPQELTPEEIKNVLLQVYHEKWKFLSDKQLIQLEWPIFNLGLYAYSLKKYQFAENCFHKLEGLGCSFFPLELLKILTAWKLGDKENSLQALEKLQQAYPKNRFLLIDLGLMYHSFGEQQLSCRYLLRGAVILSKLSGKYKRSEITELGRVKFQQNDYSGALVLLQEIAEESESERIWIQVGYALVQQRQYRHATTAFHKAQVLHPHSKSIRKNLHKIHNYFCEVGEDQFEQGLYLRAVQAFEDALKAVRKINTIKRTAQLYNVLNKKQASQALMTEYKKILEQRKQEKFKKQRQGHITAGKSFLREKSYSFAIHSFEEAFRMEPDQDVLMFLAHIYKGLNRPIALRELMLRWKRHQTRQRRLKEKAPYAYEG